MKKITLLAAVAALGLSFPQTSMAADGAENFDLKSPPVTLDSIAARKCSARTETGLGYHILREGSGATPSASDTVTVGYAGYFMADGSKFDNSSAASFPVTGVIKGFGEGLMRMKRGALYRLCIPSDLGYGDVTRGPISAKSNLIFLVEMIDF